MNKIQAFTIASIVLIFSTHLSGQTQDPPTPEELKPRLVEKQMDDISDIHGWEIKVLYPELRLQGDVPAGDFNEKVRSIALGEASRFKKDVERSIAEGYGPKNGINWYISVGYTAKHFDGEIVSILFGISEYSGGAHPNHWTRTLNYDIGKGKALELTDLFKPESGYLGEISKYSIELLQKKGDTNDIGVSWANEGAGPELKNFSSWNITKEGMFITFDPYQVGPYAAGSFDVNIPYEWFSNGVRGESFYGAQRVSYIDGSPPNWCRGGRWTISDEGFKLASVKGAKNTRAYFHGDENGGPRGSARLNAYVIAGDEVLVKREYGDYSCVWYQPEKGSETTGWVRSDQLDLRVDVPRPPFRWTGRWTHALNDIEIKETKGGKLHVYGTALWKGLGDNVHIGEIDYLGIPGAKGVLVVGDGTDEYDCRVRLERLGKYLIVSDNMNCGGMNVTFNGVYLRKP